LRGRGPYRTFKKEGIPFLVGDVSGKPLLIVIIDAKGWKRFHGGGDYYQQIPISCGNHRRNFMRIGTLAVISGSGWRCHTP
jgi:hypothetical protein